MNAHPQNLSSVKDPFVLVKTNLKNLNVGLITMALAFFLHNWWSSQKTSCMGIAIAGTLLYERLEGAGARFELLKSAQGLRHDLSPDVNSAF